MFFLAAAAAAAAEEEEEKKREGKARPQNMSQLSTEMLDAKEAYIRICGENGAAAYQLGNISYRLITEVKQC